LGIGFKDFDQALQKIRIIYRRLLSVAIGDPPAKEGHKMRFKGDDEEIRMPIQEGAQEAGTRLVASKNKDGGVGHSAKIGSSPEGHFVNE
jgi:hypothetical protein